MIYINFKSYTQSSGDNAISIALSCELAMLETKVSIVPIVATTDIWRVTQHTDIPVWAQHIDPFEPGAHTGFATIESVIKAGARGTILNHSEHTVDFDILKQTVERTRKVDPSFSIMICVPDVESLKNASKLSPDFLAYEPPALIANKTASVATEKTEEIADAVKEAYDIPLIVGAGVKNTNDINTSISLGAKGVLIASAVVKSKDPKQLLVDLAYCFT